MLARVLLACLLSHPAHAVAQSLDGWAGAYRRQDFDYIDGRRFPAENILEIVPIGPGAAYFRFRTIWHNGHRCAMSGIAEREGDVLVYRRPRHPWYDAECRLQIVRRQGELLLEDPGEHCRFGVCGARGAVELRPGEGWRVSSRRRIGYMDRLKASREYREAVAEREAP